MAGGASLHPWSPASQKVDWERCRFSTVEEETKDESEGFGHLHGNFVLMNDMNKTTEGYHSHASVLANGGKGWEPVGYMYNDNPFTGTFDGQGHTINDWCVNRNRKTIGLFGCLSGAEVSNLGLSNVTTIGYTVDTWDVVGALVGHLYESTVRQVYSTDINLYHFVEHHPDAGHGWADVGGLIGHQTRSYVYDSYSLGQILVEGEGYIVVGGFLGCTCDNGHFENIYSAVRVEGSNVSGGLVGGERGNNDSMFNKTYWNVEISGQEKGIYPSVDYPEIQGRTTEQMVYPYGGDTYDGWNFTDIWQDGLHSIVVDYAGNVGYPALAWQDWVAPQ